jgi:hypothetical protein
MEVSKKDIQLKKEELVKSIKLYIESQKELWQRLPALAKKSKSFEAIFSEACTISHNNNLWLIKASRREGTYGVAIELKTGQLIDPYMFFEYDKIVPADDRSVLYLASDLDEIDAHKIINNLRSLIKRL